jgi:hypothetical protein
LGIDELLVEPHDLDGIPAGAPFKEVHE